MSCSAFDTYSLSSSEVRTARTSPGRLWSGASPSSGESASYRGLRFSPRVNSSGHPARGFGYHLLRRFAVARGAQELKFARRSRRLLTIHLGGVYHCGPILLGMVPNAQTHLEVADLYEKLSADENASLQTRLEGLLKSRLSETRELGGSATMVRVGFVRKRTATNRWFVKLHRQGQIGWPRCRVN